MSNLSAIHALICPTALQSSCTGWVVVGEGISEHTSDHAWYP
jgi:hypothetical protein